MWILWKSQAVTKGKVFESCTLMEILQYTQSRKIIKSHHDSKFNLVLPQSIRQMYHAFSYLSTCDIRNNSRKATVWLFIWRINKHLNVSFFSLIFLVCLFVYLVWNALRSLKWKGKKSMLHFSIESFPFQKLQRSKCPKGKNLVINTLPVIGFLVFFFPHLKLLTVGKIAL